ncbi:MULTISPECIES: alpha/beta hydrolase fold domain-containing protein [Paraburkholderia]|uniref:alpha/beta hydrolase fold domain-containing protein n=1 Tax=Paraburkholderia TaxID=1822464 RepID=UPI00224E2BFC|nr:MULTISPECIES: alpha/beta hydrolase fold domain-containing protein [Paraburkholderia]MCX4160919.1 alpha/beta hydrolase fold domain-containing protein [Paraburkholderia megapolitana]MDN7156415.1 alpha/beta hydrolase [Paraburkholderia sp. CHISQ3]MDQ6493460.1 alpha/beta hydrolase [Paraburkholderia megapolitana]
MASLKHRLIVLLFRGIQYQRRSWGNKLPQKLAESCRKPGERPKHVSAHLRVEHTTILGKTCYALSPSSAVEPTCLTQVLYLHGGGYVDPIHPAHWEFLQRLVYETGCRVVVPLYPRTPEHDFKDTRAMVELAYENLLGDVPKEKFVIMGDSAGGGLALAFAQQLVTTGRTPPRELILISPWLDVTMDHPDISYFESRDPWLDRYELVVCGEMYAGTESTAHPFVSPINGTVKGIDRVTVFIGGRDILLPDCVKFATSAKKDTTVNIVYEPEMIHVWPILPIPEAQAAQRAIFEAVLFPELPRAV